MSSYAEKAKAKRAEWRQNGICTKCGKRTAFGAYKRCEYCIESESVRQYEWQRKNREKLNEYARERRQQEIQDGKCPACHKPNPDLSRVYCPKCRAKDHARYIRRYIHKIRPDGVCLRCDRPTEPGKKLCDVHRAFACEAGKKGRAAQDKNKHPWFLDEQIRRNNMRWRNRPDRGQPGGGIGVATCHGAKRYQ